MEQNSKSVLEGLAEDARGRVKRGYYAFQAGATGRRVSLTGALRGGRRVPIIAEIKYRSPSEGVISRWRDVTEMSRAYERGGASAVSVLTEPDNFEGRLEYIPLVKKAVRLPILMKDIIVDRAQVEAAGRAGADAVLLIMGIFTAGMGDVSIDEMVKFCHEKGLETVVEVHEEAEFDAAINGEGDVVGINNRNLRSMKVSLETSKMLLRQAPHPKPIICESGISTREEIEALKKLGADGFLIGSALMRAGDPEEMLRQLAGVGPW